MKLRLQTDQLRAVGVQYGAELVGL
jgi:hypothetical protein